MFFYYFARGWTSAAGGDGRAGGGLLAPAGPENGL